VAGEEIINVGGVDPPRGSELVAGQLAAPDPVTDRAVGDREEAGESALGEESNGSGFLCMPLMSKGVGICIG
jgi:hypothetical protein